MEPDVSGPVERGVAAEIDGLASVALPGLAQVKLASARIFGYPAGCQ